MPVHCSAGIAFGFYAFSSLQARGDFAARKTPHRQFRRNGWDHLAQWIDKQAVGW